MGFHITCPNCGVRSYHEFWFGEEVRAGGAGSDDETREANFNRVWLRANAAGRQHERWFHFAGCRRWLTLERDTTTNAVEGQAAGG